MKKKKSKSKLNEREGELSRYVPLNHLKLLIRVYQFIKDFRDNLKNLPDYPAEEIEDLNRILIKLKNGGWISESNKLEMMKKMEMSLFLGDRNQELLHYNYWQKKKRLFYPDGTLKSGIKIVSKIKGAPAKDEFNILIYALITCATKAIKNKSTAFILVSDFLNKRFETPDQAFDSKSLEKQHNRLRKTSDELKEIYNFYYKRSVAVKTPNTDQKNKGAKIILYYRLPSWEELIMSKSGNRIPESQLRPF